MPVRWVKSSCSDPYNDCVEVADGLDRLRGSKNPGGRLWPWTSGFAAAVKSGRFDEPLPRPGVVEER